MIDSHEKAVTTICFIMPSSYQMQNTGGVLLSRANLKRVYVRSIIKSFKLCRRKTLRDGVALVEHLKS